MSSKVRNLTLSVRRPSPPLLYQRGVDIWSSTSAEKGCSSIISDKVKKKPKDIKYKALLSMMIFELFLEADECYRKDETTVFINVTRSDSKHFINVFWRHNRGKRSYQLGPRRSRRRCCRLLLVKPPGEPPHRMSIVVLGQRVLSASSFTHPIWVVNLEIADF